jgi:hypothetical protein
LSTDGLMALVGAQKQAGTDTQKAKAAWINFN